VTPYELSLALNTPVDGAPAWGTDWISDFATVMTFDTPEVAPEEDEDIPHFSLVTGKLVHTQTSRPMKIHKSTEEDYDATDALVKSERQVAVRKDGTVAVRGVPSLAGRKLVERSWKGLEGSVGDDLGAEVEIGRDGVARGYKAIDDTVR
jgi:hypothetical protein